jgi:hypothetical protein
VSQLALVGYVSADQITGVDMGIVGTDTHDLTILRVLVSPILGSMSATYVTLYILDLWIHSTCLPVLKYGTHLHESTR